MSAYIGEFLGTMLLVLLGDSVCCNINLKKSNFKGSSTTLCIIGWGLAVMLPAIAFCNICAASFNPALTIALCADGTLPWSICAGYIIAEMLGGFVGAIIVWIMWKPQFDVEEDPGTIRGVFCCGPAIRNIPMNIIQEAIATFCLVFFIKAIGNCGVADGGVAKAIVYGIIVSCGASFGGATGYAMNAARDIAPRAAHSVLPIPKKGDSDWGYAIVTLLGPIIGALAAVGLFAICPF